MKKYLKLEYIRYALLALLLIFIIILCQGDRISNADIATVTENVLAAVGSDGMNQGNHQMIRRLYGLDPNDYEGISLYYPDTNMGAKEFLIVKMNSTDQYNTVESAMNSRVETQKGIFEGYAPEQYAMVENYELCHEGNYVLLVISEDPQAAVNAFRKSL
ncbi:MAG TPA: DUF4358 domain-containing protein [Candidatus Scybalocola faecigallinarum]|uniref:DUF4358 domain-containing protein n=1 Tax=Candidatus Scybalocola faecigallinarum TaxID=2840941 RepID=A0A9D1JS26_9FIRM|nr:DUF4358 domain-containing protein [Candidatus Scybalocola faecigallinarum]